MARMAGPCALLVIGLILAGCGASTNVNIEHEPDADFSSFQTYAWLPEEDGGESGDSSQSWR